MSAELKRICLDKAIAFLKAAGAEYVVTYEGEVFQSAAPEQEPHRKVKRAPRKIMNSFAPDTEYNKKIELLKPGQVIRFERAVYAILQEKAAYNSFRATVTSCCRRTFGPNNFIIRANDREIEVMRTV